MKITQIKTAPLRIPLKRPFITALRTVYALENVLVTIHTDTGQTGYGEAAAATAVTGETVASIQTAVKDFIAPVIMGQAVCFSHTLTSLVQQSIPYNPSAKAAVEAALFNLNHSLCTGKKSVTEPTEALGNCLPENNITISIGEGELMAVDCLHALDEGFSHIKIKLGRHPENDGETLLHIWRVLREQRPGAVYTFRIDANGGWQPKEAVAIIRKWEDAGVPLSWVEQPTHRGDINGLGTVTRHTGTAIMADESVFTPQDAVRLFENHAADWINIKLAKAGGISQAGDIAALCRVYRVPWMMGCMLESRLAVSVAAACAAKWGAAAIDLDGPLLCGSDPFTGGVKFNGPEISFSNTPITLREEAL